VVQDPAHPLSDTPASFTGVLVEPFEVFVLNRYDPYVGVQGEIDRWMGTVVLQTDSGRVEATMAPQFELVGDWFFAKGVEPVCAHGTQAALVEKHARAMAAFDAPTSWWQRRTEQRYLWALTIPVGTTVRVERFDAYAELRPRGGYRTGGSSTVRVRSHRFVVIVEERKVAADALEPFRPPPPFGLTIPIALALFPMLAIVCAGAGLVEVGRWLAYTSPMLPALAALVAGAEALERRRAKRRVRPGLGTEALDQTARASIRRSRCRR